MKNILDAFYYGKIRPAERSFAPGSDFQKVSRAFCQCSDQLKDSLSGDEKELFYKLSNLEGELDAFTAREYWLDGFRVGARMMMEMLTYQGDGLLEYED